MTNPSSVPLFTIQHCQNASSFLLGSDMFYSFGINFFTFYIFSRSPIKPFLQATNVFKKNLIFEMWPLLSQNFVDHYAHLWSQHIDIHNCSASIVLRPSQMLFTWHFHKMHHIFEKKIGKKIGPVEWGFLFLLREGEMFREREGGLLL